MKSQKFDWNERVVFNELHSIKLALRMNTNFLFKPETEVPDSTLKKELQPSDIMYVYRPSSQRTKELKSNWYHSFISHQVLEFEIWRNQGVNFTGAGKSDKPCFSQCSPLKYGFEIRQRLEFQTIQFSLHMVLIFMKTIVDTSIVINYAQYYVERKVHLRLQQMFFHLCISNISQLSANCWYSCELSAERWWLIDDFESKGKVSYLNMESKSCMRSVEDEIRSK